MAKKALGNKKVVNIGVGHADPEKDGITMDKAYQEKNGQFTEISKDNVMIANEETTREEREDRE